jgi:hypothetical protein
MPFKFTMARAYQHTVEFMQITAQPHIFNRFSAVMLSPLARSPMKSQIRNLFRLFRSGGENALPGVSLVGFFIVANRGSLEVYEYFFGTLKAKLFYCSR